MVVKPTLDAESQKVLTEADHVKNMTNSEGWKIVKDKLDALILDLQNINNLDLTDLTTLSTQLGARKMASDIIFGWLKNDVYGFIEQQESNLAKEQTASRDAFIDIGKEGN